MKFDNQLRHASAVIAAYHGGTPLHAWLKDFFREHKQMGSRDRKQLSNLVYGFYRLGHAVKGMPVEERLLLGLFLCYDAPGDLLGYFRPQWHAQAALPLEDKIAIARDAGFDPEAIFPWKDQLSAGIDHHAFCLSFLRQPNLFLRIRPGHEKEVLGKAVPGHEFIPPATLQLPNGFKVEEHFAVDEEVVIQDYSSQRIAGFLPSSPTPHTFWDACAASGGKSILAFDLYPGIDITVSDLRESILHNLRQRFRQAGIKKYNSYMADLEAPDFSRPRAVDLILADVPCTGSGTWSRTPEECYFFNPATIDRYQRRQKKIMTNIIHGLSPGTQLVYSTCSVFRKENEDIVALMREQVGSAPAMAGSINGYDQKADTMFAARFVAGEWS